VIVPPRLGLDTYMVHRTLTAKDPALKRDLWWVLDQLESLGLTGVQIDPSHFPGQDAATLERIAKATRPKGHYVEFGMGGWGVDRLQERIKLTARFGGKALRTFCGDENSPPDKLALFLEAAPPAFREAAATAEEYGVDIAVENHGDFTIAQMKELIERTNHPRVGVCFDTGNALFRDEDPMEAARVLMPYTTSMHLKDWTMWRGPDGKHQWREAPLGEGQVPVKDILELMVRNRPGLFMALESPARISDDESETVQREWRHLVDTAARANRMLAELGVSHVRA
jgi:sugar phosphate isomerase/epimerase